MDQAIKVQWMKALRSGTYQQGKKYLRREEYFCCLGVLCDLVIKAHNLEQWGKESCTPTYHLRGRYGSLSPDIESITQLCGSEQVRLSMMNDRGDSFAEIASYIERSL